MGDQTIIRAASKDGDRQPTHGEILAALARAQHETNEWRRASDARFVKLETLMVENTDLTRSINDHLRAGRLVVSAAKWISAAVIGFAATWAAVKALLSGGHV